MFNLVKKLKDKSKKIKDESQMIDFKYCITVICFFLFQISSQAQCAMCRAVLETEEGGAKAEAVNDGIVYLMIIPYILVGVVGYFIYKSLKKKA